ncbi:MAG: hypothetical protein ACYTFW_25000, partial [Planctomycetota bacterium]
MKYGTMKNVTANDTTIESSNIIIFPTNSLYYLINNISIACALRYALVEGWPVLIDIFEVIWV